MYVYIHVYMCTTYVCTHVYNRVCTCMYVYESYLCVFVYVFVFVCLYVRVCMYVHREGWEKSGGYQILVSHW